jgi:hypothetical protein
LNILKNPNDLNLNNQFPSTNNQIMTKIPMTGIQIPSPHPSPLGGEGKGEGRFGYLNIG